MQTDAKNVLVCGTCFGEHYLAAIAAPENNFNLCGILARGGLRSRALADHFQVPLYRAVTEIPANAVDVACVVVRSKLFGGQGTELAKALLERGISVLQEHPVHPGEVMQLKQLAEISNAKYHVNSFYPHLAAGRTFIDYAFRTRAHCPPSFADITTSPQLLYSSLDILGRSLGGLSGFRCYGPHAYEDEDFPFHAFQGVVADVPFHLALQSYMDPKDPDHHSLVTHRLMIGRPEGNLNLINSFGPVIWTSSLYAPNYRQDGKGSSFLLHPEGFINCRHFVHPSAEPLGSARGASFVDVVGGDFPGAIFRALSDLLIDIESPGTIYFQSEGYLNELGNAWLTILRQAGHPKSKSMPEPPPPQPDPVEYAKEIENAG